MNAFDPQQGHRPGYPYGRDPSTGLSENHGLGAGTVFPWGFPPEPGPPESEDPGLEVQDRIRQWPAIPAMGGVGFLLYGVSAGSSWNAARLNVSERGGYIVLAVAMLLVAAVAFLASARQDLS